MERLFTDRASVNDVCRFCARSSSPGSRWQCRSIKGQAPQKLILARDLARAPNMARTGSVVCTTLLKPVFRASGRGTGLPFRAFLSSLGMRRFGLSEGSCRVAPSGHSRVSEICRRLWPHRRKDRGRQNPRRLSALTALLVEAWQKSRVCRTPVGCPHFLQRCRWRAHQPRSRALKSPSATLAEGAIIYGNLRLRPTARRF